MSLIFGWGSPLFADDVGMDFVGKFKTCYSMFVSSINCSLSSYYLPGWYSMTLLGPCRLSKSSFEPGSDCIITSVNRLISVLQSGTKSNLRELQAHQRRDISYYAYSCDTFFCGRLNETKIDSSLFLSITLRNSSQTQCSGSPSKSPASYLSARVFVARVCIMCCNPDELGF